MKCQALFSLKTKIIKLSTTILSRVLKINDFISALLIGFLVCLPVGNRCQKNQVV